jgi:transcriptional regulator of acetoin/glycerol metabolism
MKFKEAIRAAERAYLERVLHEAKWNIPLAAQMAGLDRTTIYKVAHRVGLMGKKK